MIRKIQELRKHGYSVPEISKMCTVSRSSALRYSRLVSIEKQYYQRWLNRRNASRILSERQWNIARQQTQKSQQGLEKWHLILIGASLYWAEGAKRDFTFSNTDPEMVRIFLMILRKAFGVENHRIKISLRIYEDLHRQNCLAFWSKVTGLRLGPNTSIDVLRGTKHGKLPYGMCRVRVQKPGVLLKEIKTVIERMCVLIQ